MCEEARRARIASARPIGPKTRGGGGGASSNQRSPATLSREYLGLTETSGDFGANSPPDLDSRPSIYPLKILNTLNSGPYAPI